MTIERKKTAPLGKILLQLKKITFEQLGQALVIQKEKCPNKMLGEILVDLEYISQDELYTALALQFQFPHIDIRKYSLSKDVLDLIPKNTVRKYKVLPLDRFGDILTVALFNPIDNEAIAQIRKITGLQIRIFVAFREELDETISLVYK